MGFPPGLLPELVREKLRTDAPYSPLSPLDIERAALPPPSAPDAYLAARLDKFHAELRVRARAPLALPHPALGRHAACRLRCMRRPAPCHGVSQEAVRWEALCQPPAHVCEELRSPRAPLRPRPCAAPLQG